MSLQGQFYDTKQIIDKADSIVKSNVGDSAYKYLKYDVHSYYEFRTSKNKTQYKSLIKNSYTKGHFVQADVRFELSHPVLQGLIMRISVVLDSALNLKDSIYLNQIPNFLLQGKSCDFITSEKVLSIAKDSLKYKGIEEIDHYIDYNSVFNRYVYIVHNTLTRQKDRHGKDNGNVEVLFIDAVTGEVLERFESWYGPIY